LCIMVFHKYAEKKKTRMKRSVWIPYRSGVIQSQKKKRHSKPLYKTKSQNKNVGRIDKARQLSEMNETGRYPVRETCALNTLIQ
jgi:hypothetical protein